MFVVANNGIGRTRVVNWQTLKVLSDGFQSFVQGTLVGLFGFGVVGHARSVQNPSHKLDYGWRRVKTVPPAAPRLALHRPPTAHWHPP